MIATDPLSSMLVCELYRRISYYSYGIFYYLFYGFQKPCRRRTIDDPVVTGQAQTDLGFGYYLITFNNRFLHNPPNPQQGTFRRSENGCKIVYIGKAEIADRKGAICQIIGKKLIRLCFID